MDLEGQLSNPVQRRLTDTGIDDLVARYEAGSTIETLAHQFGVHRTTVMTHLDPHGIPRRAPRKLTDQMVTAAAQRYASGDARRDRRHLRHRAIHADARILAGRRPYQASRSTAFRLTS